ncbi:hypothetical protein [Streptomyces sp. RerS4]|uniref:hypothetical protein n=1 Tax=Streptomyces sp. RerS4 TaxID=2942449 RepID=UPI00201C764E|nr:hypothetical protein [Streptomyces sp. RerS4]UQX01898.1 hypothetical protein M4D82_16335 [Streptomyces sp. RerS4]
MTAARTSQDLVREFHEAFGLNVAPRPTSVAPELADVVYIAYGTALVHGIDLDAVLAEIHRADMSKPGPDGRPTLREDGKVLKGAAYRPPRVADVLRDQA